MIISEKQILLLMQAAEIFLSTMKELKNLGCEQTEIGKENKENVAKLLKQIVGQQSEELKNIE